jgi:hypothetical protein
MINILTKKNNLILNILIELNNKYQGRSAVVIMGGPSIIENNYDLSILSEMDHIIFLESKALTPKFLEYGIVPDYYMMFYPEKTRTNTLQYQFIQALSSGFDLGPCLKEKHVQEWLDFKDNFGNYADIWRIAYPNKRYRIKKDVVLQNSPISLIEKLPKMKLITYDKAYEADKFGAVNIPNQVYTYTHNETLTDNLDNYFNPEVVNGKLTISNIGTINSAAIALYPLLNYMGFTRVIFIGMDMSMLGHLEYASCYTFKSLKHFNKFVNYSRETFSAVFPRGISKGLKQFTSSILYDFRYMNIKQLLSTSRIKALDNDLFGLQRKFMRTKNEIRACRELFDYINVDYINVYEPSFKYAEPIPNIRNISFSSLTKI